MSFRRKIRWLIWWRKWLQLRGRLGRRYWLEFGDYPDRLGCDDPDDTWLTKLPVNCKNLRDIAKYWRAYHFCRKL